MSKTNSNLFHDETLVFDCENLDNRKISIYIDNNSKNTNTDLTKNKFGLLTLKAATSTLTSNNLEFIFQIDCSGSMQDRCADGRTKMEHILHTLRNIIFFFKENKELNVNITIHAFDDNIYKIVEHSPINQDTYQKIITSINLIQPKGATNIEKALIDTKIIAVQLKQQYPESIIHHILMTDGRPTSGSGSYDLLQALIDDSYTNTFIGFGIDHDAALLKKIGSSNEKSSNYFIDQLENAGLVYGEILHGFIYKLLKNVEISVDDGIIYDFKTNTWKTKINVGDVVSDSLKFYHIVSNTPNKCKIYIYGKKVYDETNFSKIIYQLTSTFADLAKYIYRQRTQEILFKINDFLQKINEETNQISFMKLPNFNEIKPDNNPEKNNLKQELNDLFEELKQYMQDNNLNEDVLLKNLCDDIYICHKTIGTQYAQMYCEARMSSQGNQRTYTATKIPNEEIEFSPENVIKRSNAGEYSNVDNKIILPLSPSLLHHEVSESLATPYCNASNMRVMREVSDFYKEKE